MNIFEEYFKAIGIREPIQKRIAEVFDMIKRMYPNEEFVDVSINEFLDEEGVKHFKDVRFYSSNIQVNAVDFLIKNDFVISPSHQTLFTLNVESENYDFIQANEKSRLLITGFFTKPSTRTILNGIGINCDYLFEIFKKYFQPKLT